MVTTNQLNNALTACGYSAVSEATTIVKHINQMTTDSNEAAMFVAQLIHESGGFQHRSEVNGSRQHYAPYYGRGYIQLTHDYNYKAASRAIFGDDRLLQNPDLVSSSADMSMRVSVWFWEANVGPKNNFGQTTAAINGSLEPAGSTLARRRYELYLKVARVFGIEASEY